MNQNSKKWFDNYRKNCVAICGTCGRYCFHHSNFKCINCDIDFQMSWVVIEEYGK